MYKKHHMIISCNKKSRALPGCIIEEGFFIGSDLLQHHLRKVLNAHLHTSHHF